MSDKIIELAASIISGVQSRNAGIVANLKTRFEQSSEKLVADVKSSMKKEAAPAKPKPSLWLLARKRWAWKYREAED